MQCDKLGKQMKVQEIGMLVRLVEDSKVQKNKKNLTKRSRISGKKYYLSDRSIRGKNTSKVHKHILGLFFGVLLVKFNLFIFWLWFIGGLAGFSKSI